MNENPHDTLPHPAAPSAELRASSRFQYAGGDRPLAGYTIRRGVGQGGFGEIYYATNDAGKDVALKLIRRNLDVELRGIRQCLNLRHPHLLDLYDIRQDDRGDTWVVMEYMAGRSLEDALADRPHGMPVAEALSWIHGLGAGVAHLHEHGIVHRDLKPGNIFCDGGVVKVGDYGLAKFISCSRRSGHTESIGTVHYMAPEVAGGRYGKEIDVYAMGVLLYELLTGRVPFEGESIGEVLMKHLSARPDVSMLDEPYRSVVARALEKDPARRFSSAADMLAALPSPSPADGFCRVPVGQVVLPAPDTEKTADSSHNAEKPTVPILFRGRPRREPPSPLSWRERLTERLGAMLGGAMMVVVLCVAATLLECGLGRDGGGLCLERFAWLVTTGVLGVWGVLIPAGFWRHHRGDAMLRRLTMLVVGLVVGAATFVASQWLWVRLPAWRNPLETLNGFEPAGFYAVDGRPLVLGFAACFGTLFALVGWWRQTSPARPSRLRIRTLLAVFVTAYVVALVWHFPQPWLPTIAVVVSASVQLASPWTPRGEAPRTKIYQENAGG
ncbi:MAG: serine/threonine protein kinase [Planctomycetaceae bacterium]|nr:serine/threonine protein kinase [Planctomycetaceae bacterium]